MEDFKKNRPNNTEEEALSVKTGPEQRAEISQQERSAQHEEPGNSTGNYSYDEYDSYSPWG